MEWKVAWYPSCELEVFQGNWIVGPEKQEDSMPHSHAFYEIFAADKKAWKEQEGKHIELKSASEAKVSCMNHNIGFQRSCSGLVQNVFLVQQSLGSVKSLLTLKWTGRLYPRLLVTFPLFHHWWPWIQSSLLVSGHQRLQRRSCEHFGFATDHLTLGRAACGEL